MSNKIITNYVLLLLWFLTALCHEGFSCSVRIVGGKVYLGRNLISCEKEITSQDFRKYNK